MSPKLKLVLNLVVAIVLIDQATKLLVDRTMLLHDSIPVIDNFFSLTYIRNTGAAFGIFADSHELFRLTFLIAFSLAAIGFILVMLRRLPESEKALTGALAFILGGAVGNLIDRLVYGEVIDFLDFYWSGYHWPAFNVADSFITIGVLIMLFRLATTRDADPFAPRP
ncbi:MAG: signal peptidase II [Candidatus Binatia bacterium]